MYKTLAPNERLIQVATVAYRGRDGMVERGVPLYEIVSADDIDPVTGLVRRDEQACRDASKLLAAKYAEYVRQCKARGLEDRI